jgi:hypothetical protein
VVLDACFVAMRKVEVTVRMLAIVMVRMGVLRNAAGASIVIIFVVGQVTLTIQVEIVVCPSSLWPELMLRGTIRYVLW